MLLNIFLNRNFNSFIFLLSFIGLTSYGNYIDKSENARSYNNNDMDEKTLELEHETRRLKEQESHMEMNKIRAERKINGEYAGGRYLHGAGGYDTNKNLASSYYE